MKTLHQWLAEYGESHTHPTNIKIHKICVPLIMLSIFGLLWTLPTPWSFSSLPLFNWTTLFIALSLLFYLRLSIPYALGILLESTLMVLLITLIEDWSSWPSWTLYLGIFVLAWIMQFVGHKIEGKKPSFFKDLQFLLIGPLWTLQPFYRFLGLLDQRPSAKKN